MSPWITFLRGYYNDKKKKQPNYTYKSAMKDGAKDIANQTKNPERQRNKWPRTSQPYSFRSEGRRPSTTNSEGSEATG